MSLNNQITVITHGRFHSFDLAEQIQAAGRLAAIFSGYPRFKLKNTRVAPDRIHSFPWFVVPHMALLRLNRVPSGWLNRWAWHGGEALNRFAAGRLPDCGVVSALSGSGREAGREIQRRGGVYLCDRGSTHIRWQERLLAAEYDRLGLPFEQLDPRPFENEEIEYAMADAITLPSQFTRQSFIAMGVPAAKLKVVPYGVNLAAFHRVAPRSERFRILFVGQLCVRKGLHDLLDCFADLALSDAELVLVGGHTADTEALLRRARLDNVRLTGLLSRAAVAVEMSRATVMVLPSLEEGLALVMAQALACGCPVIASTHTGAEDLFDDGVEGFIIPPSDQEALAGRILQFYRDRTLAPAMGEKAVARMAAMGGFERYGRASLALFDELLRAKGIPVSAG